MEYKEVFAELSAELVLMIETAKKLDREAYKKWKARHMNLVKNETENVKQVMEGIFNVVEGYMNKNKEDFPLYFEAAT